MDISGKGKWSGIKEARIKRNKVWNTYNEKVEWIQKAYETGSM